MPERLASAVYGLLQVMQRPLQQACQRIADSLQHGYWWAAVPLMWLKQLSHSELLQLDELLTSYGYLPGPVSPTALLYFLAATPR